MGVIKGSKRGGYNSKGYIRKRDKALNIKLTEEELKRVKECLSKIEGKNNSEKILNLFKIKGWLYLKYRVYFSRDRGKADLKKQIWEWLKWD